MVARTRSKARNPTLFEQFDRITQESQPVKKRCRTRRTANTTTRSDASIQTEPINLVKGQRCPVCGAKPKVPGEHHPEDDDTSNSNGTASSQQQGSPSPQAATWRKQNGRDRFIQQEVIPQGVVSGRIGKNFPKTQSIKPKGLLNLGVSCYRNAMLQCLLHTPHVYHLLGNIHKDCSRAANRCTTCVVQKVFQTYWNSDRSDDDEHGTARLQLRQLMEDLRDALRANIPNGNKPHEQGEPGYLLKNDIQCESERQSSSFDFARAIIEIMAGHVQNNVAARKQVSQAFEVKLRGAWTCPKCDKVHRDAGETTQIGLEVNPFALLPQRGLHLKEYLSQDTLVLKNPYSCEGVDCTAAREAANAAGSYDAPEMTKNIRITQAPEVLLIRIQRIGAPVNQQNELYWKSPVKLEDRIDFDEFLDLRPHSDDLGASQYRLRGVVYHKGSAKSGHFVAMVRNIAHDKNFHLCNDMEVDDAVLDESRSFGPEDQRYTPYVLVYSQI